MNTNNDESIQIKDSYIQSVIKVLFFFRNELAYEKKTVFIFLFLTIGVSLVDIACPFLSQQLFDIAIPEKNIDLAVFYSLEIIGSLLFAYVIYLVVVRSAIVMTEKAVYTKSKTLISQILAKDPVFFDHYDSADIITRFANDLYRIGEFFLDYVLFNVIYLTITVAFIIWMFYLNWILAAICCACFSLYFLFSALRYRPIVRNSRKAQDKNSERNEQVEDILDGETEIRVYQQQSAFLERFNIKGLEYCNAQITSLWSIDFVWATLDRFSRIMNVLPIIIGAIFICYETAGATIGVLVAFSQVMFYCSRYITSLAYSSIRSLSVVPLIDRVNELLDAYPKIDVPPIRIEQAPDSGAIEFRDVSFTYPSGKQIFNRFNLTIRPGEKIAIMAPSGFGKTTFARLLLGLVQPDSGVILFGDEDIRTFPPNFFYTYFSYVSQNSHIFKLSVRDNIEMGWLITNNTVFNSLLENLHIRDFINALPKREDTILNVEGLSLSKGQQQRISLARALIRVPQVLIADEFTSGLDSVTEKQILDDLFTIMKDQTIICITHSSSVAKRMDRTVMLNVLSDEQSEDRNHR